MEDPSYWTEADLLALVGRPESFRLEFKSGQLFKARDKAIETLSKEVSALANSEGGLIVLGMAERKEGKSRVAHELDGLDANEIPTPWLQQVVEASVSPAVSGMRFKTVRLADQPGRVCIIVAVPQGTTAHQAQDRRYYGRSEFEAKSLPDHEIRLRMQKGRVKRAGLTMTRWVTEYHFGFADGLTGRVDPLDMIDRAHTAGVEEMREAALSVSEVLGDSPSVTFGLGLRNEGELTIREAMLELAWYKPTGLSLFIDSEKAGSDVRMPMRWPTQPGFRLHPGDTANFPNHLFSIINSESQPINPGEGTLRWRVFMEDTPAAEGTLDVFETAPSGRSVGLDRQIRRAVAGIGNSEGE